MANRNVHTGFWVDHSSGPVLGATITLETKYGSQLISAATVVVNIIGVALWSILAFSIHQWYAHPGLRDEFDAQRQVILRNSAGAETTAWSLLKHGILWRGGRKNVLREAVLTALIPAVMYICFIVAGIFVGQIATNSYDTTSVLLKGGPCGFVQSNGQMDSLEGIQHVMINVSTVSRQYAQSCYGGGGTASAISCSVYPVPALEYDIEYEQPCPFLNDACFNDSISKPITLRTKPLDSHSDLGINAKEQNRLTLEYQTTCAPLDYGFVDTYSNSTDRMFAAGVNATEISLNLGRYYSGLPSLFYYRPLIRVLGIQTIGYSLNSFQSIAPHDSNVSDWQPASPFAQTPGDLTFMVLAPNAVTFTGPVEDVMFQTSEQPTEDQDYLQAPYIPSRPLYAMACSETYQICNPTNSQCTGWLGTFGINNAMANATSAYGLNEHQNATFVRLAQLTFNANLYGAVQGIPDPLLASTYFTSPASSQPLPNGFWRTEVEGWFQAALAKLQYLQTIFVNVPLDIVQANGIQLLDPASVSPLLSEQCSQQRVTSPAQYTNYNFFALIFIACFGIIVPTIAMTLQYFHRHLPFVNQRGHRYLSYQAEGVMQLHRMALEGAGYEGWKLSSDDIPRTDTATKRLPQVALMQDDEGAEETLRYPTRIEAKGDDDDANKDYDVRSGYHEVAKTDDAER